MPAARNSFCSSGQISSWRFLYSAAVPGFSFILKAWRCMGSICRLMAFQPGAKADDNRGENKRDDAASDEQVGLFAGTFPFVEDPAPHGRENDDAGHVQRPRCEIILAH